MFIKTFAYHARLESWGNGSSTYCIRPRYRMCPRERCRESNRIKVLIRATDSAASFRTYEVIGRLSKAFQFLIGHST